MGMTLNHWNWVTYGSVWICMVCCGLWCFCWSGCNECNEPPAASRDTSGMVSTLPRRPPWPRNSSKCGWFRVLLGIKVPEFDILWPASTSLSMFKLIYPSVPCQEFFQCEPGTLRCRCCLSRIPSGQVETAASSQALGGWWSSLISCMCKRLLSCAILWPRLIFRWFMLKALDLHHCVSSVCNVLEIDRQSWCAHVCAWLPAELNNLFASFKPSSASYPSCELWHSLATQALHAGHANALAALM